MSPLSPPPLSLPWASNHWTVTEGEVTEQTFKKWHCEAGQINLHCESQQMPNAISKLIHFQFFHAQTQQCIYVKAITEDPITSQTCCYTTLWNISFSKTAPTESTAMAEPVHMHWTECEAGSWAGTKPRPATKSLFSMTNSRVFCHTDHFFTVTLVCSVLIRRSLQKNWLKQSTMQDLTAQTVAECYLHFEASEHRGATSKNQTFWKIAFKDFRCFPMVFCMLIIE